MTKARLDCFLKISLDNFSERLGRCDRLGRNPMRTARKRPTSTAMERSAFENHSRRFRLIRALPGGRKDGAYIEVMQNQRLLESISDDELLRRLAELMPRPDVPAVMRKLPARPGMTLPAPALALDPGRMVVPVLELRPDGVALPTVAPALPRPSNLWRRLGTRCSSRPAPSFATSWSDSGP